MTDFENFALYYAKSLSENSANNQTDSNLKISNTDGIKLVHCIPTNFSKRVTDTSNATSEDKTSPDSGTAVAQVQLRVTQNRETAPTTTLLKRLQHMFFLIADDTDFRKARFGLTNSDNSELDCEPDATAGYKIISFKQEPNASTPALVTFDITLEYVGDHEKLGGFS